MDIGSIKLNSLVVLLYFCTLVWIFFLFFFFSGGFLIIFLFVSRFVEKNRRDVEEKSDQLKSISNLAALFCGFATVNLTQFNVRTDYNWVSYS